MDRLKNPLVLGVIAAVAIVAVVGVLLAAEVFEGEDDDPETVTVTSAQQLTDDDDDDAVATTQTDTATVDADDIPIEPAELERVEAAALRVAGDGQVTDVDRSDDPGEAFEVEVVTDAGEVDVALDDRLHRVPNAPYDD